MVGEITGTLDVRSFGDVRSLSSMADLDTLARRLSSLIALSGASGFHEIDALAGLADGHTGQIARGKKPTPSAATVVAIARVLGTTVEYLVDGIGNAPSERRAKRAVEAAREVHANDRTSTAPSRKTAARSGAGSRRRAGGRASQASEAG